MLLKTVADTSVVYIQIQELQFLALRVREILENISQMRLLTVEIKNPIGVTYACDLLRICVPLKENVLG